MCLCDAQDVDKNITYHPIIILSNLRNMDKMIEIENIMRENGFPAQYETLNALLQGYAKTGRLEDINRMKALIEAGESEKLKNFFDILVSEHSNTAAVISLTHNLIEVGNIRQAREMIKNNLDSKSPHFCNKRCQMLTREMPVIEGLLKATDGLDLDRSDIYYYLLVVYCEQNRRCSGALTQTAG